MLEIKKKNEPRELLQYRHQPFASYADMPSEVKKKVLESLLSEQGHLCAYCMCRIDGGAGKRRATIEHCTPQSISDERERLNYRNMLAVCWGNRDAHSNDDKSCDAKRGSLPEGKQHMKRINVFDGGTLSEIQYSADGTIFSENSKVDEDLNIRLNLNCEARRLKDCRLQALRAVHRHINEKYPDRTVSKEVFRNLLGQFEKQSEIRQPYSGIIIAWLRTKV